MAKEEAEQWSERSMDDDVSMTAVGGCIHPKIALQR